MNIQHFLHAERRTLSELLRADTTLPQFNASALRRLVFDSWHFLRMRFFLSRIDEVSGIVIVKGRPKICNHGHAELAERVQLISSQCPVRLRVEEGALLKVGTRSIIDGALIEATKTIEIGDRVYVGPEVRISDRYFTAFIGYETRERHPGIRIGKGARIEAGAVILRGVRIGAGAVVKAGAIVKDDVPPFTEVGGVPARVICTGNRHRSLQENQVLEEVYALF